MKVEKKEGRGKTDKLNENMTKEETWRREKRKRGKKTRNSVCMESKIKQQKNTRLGH